MHESILFRNPWVKWLWTIPGGTAGTMQGINDPVVKTFAMFGGQSSAQS